MSNISKSTENFKKYQQFKKFHRMYKTIIAKKKLLKPKKELTIYQKFARILKSTNDFKKCRKKTAKIKKVYNCKSHKIKSTTKCAKNI